MDESFGHKLDNSPVCDQIIEFNEFAIESNDKNNEFYLLAGFANAEFLLTLALSTPAL